MTLLLITEKVFQDLSNFKCLSTHAAKPWQGASAFD
jgi:hypothetical protein